MHRDAEVQARLLLQSALPVARRLHYLVPPLLDTLEQRAPRRRLLGARRRRHIRRRLLARAHLGEAVPRRFLSGSEARLQPTAPASSQVHCVRRAQ